MVYLKKTVEILLPLKIPTGFKPWVMLVATKNLNPIIGCKQTYQIDLQNVLDLH